MKHSFNASTAMANSAPPSLIRDTPFTVGGSFHRLSDDWLCRVTAMTKASAPLSLFHQSNGLPLIQSSARHCKIDKSLGFSWILWFWYCLITCITCVGGCSRVGGLSPWMTCPLDVCLFILGSPTSWVLFLFHRQSNLRCSH